MEEADFHHALSRYRIVRSRDFVASLTPRRGAALPWLGPPPPPAGKPSPAAPATASSRRALGAGVGGPAVTPSAAAAPASDFWGALDALLAAHFSCPDVRKRVAQAFDERHYAALRGMNWDDVEDMARMLGKELEEGGEGAG